MTKTELGKASGALAGVIHATNDALGEWADSVSQYDFEAAEQIHEISWRAAIGTIETLTGKRWSAATEACEPWLDFAGCMTEPCVTGGPMAIETERRQSVRKGGRIGVSPAYGVVRAWHGATP